MILLYIISALALIVIGMLAGYFLTRHTLFAQALQPAIEKSFAHGYNLGYRHGERDVRKRAAELFSIDMATLGPDEEEE